MPPKRKRGRTGTRFSKKRTTSNSSNACCTLSCKISCDNELVSSMLPTSIEAANSVVLGLKRNGPGGPARLHAALALPGSPIEPAADPVRSLAAFQGWLAIAAFNVPGVGPGNRKGATAFDRLSAEEANGIVYGRWHIIPWVVSILNSGYLGAVARVLWLSGNGRGRAIMFLPAGQVFR